MGKMVRFKDNQMLINGKRVIVDDLSRYRVGSCYLFESGFVPAVVYGGTWERISGKFLLGEGGDYVNGAAGGSATHTLTVAEMPAHKHDLVNTYNQSYSGVSNVGSSSNWGGIQSTVSASGSNKFEADNTGGGNTHNNMPPYIVENIWRRTA